MTSNVCTPYMKFEPSGEALPFVKFPKIRSFEYICEKGREDTTVCGGGRAVTYGAKVKLHGKNVGIHIDPDQRISAQEKGGPLSPDTDRTGFCKWLGTNAEHWKHAHRTDNVWCNKHVVVFGEWAGKEMVMTAPDAVTKLPDTYFFAFGMLCDDQFFSDPRMLSAFVPRIATVKVIPWFMTPGDRNSVVNFGDDASTERFANYISDAVEAMEREDPYIKAEFGVCGPAEGLVLTPAKCGVGLPVDTFAEFTFKAKVRSHWVHRSTRPAVTRVSVPADVSQFIDKFVIEGRCQQGVSEACDGVVERSKMDNFVIWMEKDVKKESGYEREKMGVEWKELHRHVTLAATKWFQKNCRG